MPGTGSSPESLFLHPLTVVPTTGFSGCVTRELRFALGVTRELLFFGISEDV